MCMRKLQWICLGLFSLVLFAAVFTGSVYGTEDIKLAKTVVINEVMSSNSSVIRDMDGDFSDWIELYNPMDEGFDLSGFYLSDKGKNRRKWRIPEGTVIPTKGYLVIWTSGKDKISSTGQLHTNFKINQKGEPIILTESDGITLFDYVIIPPLDSNVSCGRQPDGSYNWHYFDATNVTPGYSNNNAETHLPPNQMLHPLYRGY